MRRHLSRLLLAGAALATMILVIRPGPGRPPPPTLHLVAVGDILLGDAAQRELDRKGYDFPFRRLRPYLRRADVLVGNLEGPITQAPTRLDPDKTWSYKCRPGAAAALERAGFHVLCLANNHAMDYGRKGLADTIRILKKNSIGHFGAGASYRQAVAGRVVKVGGIRFGFVGFYEATDPTLGRLGWFARGRRPGVAPLNRQTVRSAIRRLRPRVEVLVVSFHWGRNYEPVTALQKRWGRRAAAFGADLVLGHHPHVAQGVEVHRGVPILYSLGNFTFLSRGRFRLVDPRWRYGWIADVAVRGGRVAGVDLIPIAVDHRVVHYRPRPAGHKALARLVPFVNREFGAPLEIRGDRAYLPVTR
jgi:poly-gamma-glutamate synthesis protein (capsule biosynthesis protein)